MALKRSSNKIIAGVCAGFAEEQGWDPTIVRIIYAVLTLCTCSALLWVYLILWVIMPQK